MLEQKRVFAFLPLENKDILEVQRYCSSHFVTHICHLINEDIKQSLQNYRLFEDRIGQTISYNTKNIVFQSDSVGLLCLDDEDVCECDNQNPSYNTIKGKQVNEFFGKGEFPHRQFNIVRIGNKDYSFYTIHR